MSIISKVKLNSGEHKLSKLRDFLLSENNPNIINVSKKYYAPGYIDAKYMLDVTIMPKQDWLQEIITNPTNKDYCHNLIGEIRYGKNSDFLNINQFKKN